MSAKLHEFDSRTAAHAKLKELHDADPASTTECRENPQAGKTEVWDAPMTAEERAAANLQGQS